MKKLTLALAAAMLLSLLSGCGDHAAPSVLSSQIIVISREEGSGTRGAFVELMGIEDSDGDHTVETAEITNSTAVVTQTVSGARAAIGYVSFGALSDTVKAVKVDGVEATVDNIKAGTYGAARPFALCYREQALTPLGRDFIDYTLSLEGQKRIADEGYIPANAGARPYAAPNISGKLSISGSTSVAAVMEVLAEDYRHLHPQVTIDIQQTGSGAGITSAIDGSCEIGMSSRPLKSGETAQGLTETKLALDGIAVIVNRDNPIDTLTPRQICQIFTGQITAWADID